METCLPVPIALVSPPAGKCRLSSGNGLNIGREGTDVETLAASLASPVLSTVPLFENGQGALALLSSFAFDFFSFSFLGCFVFWWRLVMKEADFFGTVGGSDVVSQATESVVSSTFFEERAGWEAALGEIVGVAAIAADCAGEEDAADSAVNSTGDGELEGAGGVVGTGGVAGAGAGAGALVGLGARVGTGWGALVCTGWGAIVGLGALVGTG